MSTFQALLVALLAVLPGAVYTLARENFGASWAWQHTDTSTQIFRLLGASAVFHAVFAPLSYRAYQELVVTHEAAKGETLSWWWWAASCLHRIALRLGSPNRVVSKLATELVLADQVAADGSQVLAVAVRWQEPGATSLGLALLNVRS
jgi:hypothetical protein